ncbi:MAG: choice-of-anchor D domain-containing protein [Terracidiphilus sp.]
MKRVSGEPVRQGGVWTRGNQVTKRGRGEGLVSAALCLLIMVALPPLPAKSLQAQTEANRAKDRPSTNNDASQNAKLATSLAQQRILPPRALQAQRFLARRGWRPGMAIPWPERSAGAGHAGGWTGIATPDTGIAMPDAQSTPATWQPVGPNAVVTPGYGLVTGRVTALALDPSDATGNHLYVGTTGGGVWEAWNAAVSDASLVTFTPLTDAVGAMSGAVDASISIGALTVQPGGTGVILAGTGDPNDALDSYYGAGILRSADGGNSWTLISGTADGSFKFLGEGFAGFAWSTVNEELVVAALSQAYEGTLVNVDLSQPSYEGLYYSEDSGSTWTLATITDGANQVVQGPGALFDAPDGNAVTAVVWNPVRQLFVAAVRFHGYYQSADGITWTRLAAQPGAGLTAQVCPTQPGLTGSIDCPIFRGAMAVNPVTGDTFAWTIDDYNQDQGLWQDQCAISNGMCSGQNIDFAQQWNTQALETETAGGAATIADGDYTLALAAVPSAAQEGADTWLVAGADDLWRCSLAQGCVWRNTTNATTCMSAQVAEFQHVLAWNQGNPLEIVIGNDGGLWRSLDALGESGQVCAESDASHFQNLNGGLGSLAEVESLATSTSSPYTMMTGLGVNGTAGLKSAAAQAEWPQILGGNGGPVAIDPLFGSNWYVNNQDGVAIYLCSDPTACTPAGFGTTAMVNDDDVGGDGYAMSSPATFLVDPLDTSQLLIGTCRVWRGPANGAGWSGTNAISPILDSGATDVSCSGDALIRSMTAMALSQTIEVVYLGMYGTNDGGGSLPGHIFSAIVNSQSASMPVWQDLTLNPVTNSPGALNKYGLDISSVFADSHDPSGNTVYATVEGFSKETEAVVTVYGSTDGGAHWASYKANLPSVPVSGLVVDPQSASIVYLATDRGVYFTTQISTCALLPSTCWAEFGTGLPEAPVTELSAAPASAGAQLLTAGTYGRGVWQTPLWSAGGNLTTAAASPSPLIFPIPVAANTTSQLPVSISNTGNLPLTLESISASGDFGWIDPNACLENPVAPGAACTIEVTFSPTAASPPAFTGQMTIDANVNGGQLPVSLSGTGAPAAAVIVNPSVVSFDPSPGQNSSSPTVEVGTTSGSFQVELENSGSTAVPITSASVSPPFLFAPNGNQCVNTSLIAQGSCQFSLIFAPVQEGAAAGTLTITDGAGMQTVALSGFGYSAPTDQLSPSSVPFPDTAVGQLSTAQPVVLTNSGDLPLTSIAVSISAGFQIAQNNCGSQLAPHLPCTISLVFAPAQLGSASGTLTVSDITRAQPQTVALSGMGVQPGALSVNASSLNFSSQDLNVASAPQSLTITNTGGVAVTNMGFAITGQGATNFSCGATICSATTCAATLAPGGNCSVQVIFDPATTGVSSASLNVAADNLKAPVAVALSGSGQVISGLNVSPAQLIFAATVAGSSSPPQTVTVSNSSSVVASQLTMAASTGFVLTQNTCMRTAGTGSLAAGGTCTVGVIFAPASTGAKSGTLNVMSTSIATAANVTLSGIGALAAAIQVTSPALNFLSTGVGQTSGPITLTVTNSGAADPLSNLMLAVPAGFQLVNNTCAASLGPGASCTAGVEFAPTVAGAQSGSLTVSSSTVADGVSLPITGLGFDFTVTVSGSSSQSVASGLSANFTLLLTPLEGSAGVFTFACNSLPANAVCVFNPTGETLTSGATGNFTAQVSTGNPPASARRTGAGLWGVLPLACGLVLLPLGWKRKRGTLRGGILLLLLMAILVCGLGSCATSGGGTGSGPGAGSDGATTPVGTYSIPVTVTSTGVTHNAMLTLTVD